MTVVWSYGGGVQSVAIGVLIREGVLPKPDLAVIADTGREVRSTWDYLRGVMQPYLDPIGLKIEVAPHSLATVDLASGNGDILVPAFTAEGRLPTFCSGEWKREVVSRWLRSRGVEDCDIWIGYSIDEMRRVSAKDRRKWLRQQFPLIDKFLNRAMCRTLIEKAGLPVPHKSRCFMCPHQNEEEWREVYDDPAEWERACSVDDEIRASDPEQKGLYVHYSRMPLRTVNLSEGIQPPVMPCEGGHCWT